MGQIFFHFCPDDVVPYDLSGDMETCLQLEIKSL